jgi:SSS family solute:Na+ symporter
MAFPPVLGISVIGCIIGSLLTKPESDEVLMRFYMQVHPWGFWKPIIKKVHAYYPSFEPNRNFTRDLFNIIVGIVWQVSLVTLPIALVTQEYRLLIGIVPSIIVTSIILKFSWWNKLDELSKDTLPADFDQRISQRIQLSKGETAPVISPEGAVIYSK